MVLKYSLVLCLMLALANAEPCKKLLPGLQRMARGIDITSLDLFPSDISLLSGFRQSVFEFTCNSNQTWKHPTIKNFQFPIPDQVASINTVPGGEMNHKVTFHSDAQSYKDSLDLHVGLDAKTEAYGNYAFSVGYKKVKQEMIAFNKTIAETSAYVAAVQMDFKPHYQVKANKNFLDFVAKLESTKYEDSQEQYKEFLDTFGTHYFEMGMFGGYLLQRTEIDSKYMYEANEKDINVNLEAGFMEMVSGKFDINKQYLDSKAKFDVSTSTSDYYYGGQTDLAVVLNKEQFAKWWESVPSDPWLFGGRVKPIEYLIESENVKKEMKKAVYVKLANAYLQEAKDSLKLTRSGDNELKEIEELSNQVVPNEEKVKELKKKVDQLISADHQRKIRTNLNAYLEQLDKVLEYELFCKQEAAVRCDAEKAIDVKNDIEKANNLKQTIANMIDSSNDLYDDDVRGLTKKAYQLIKDQQTVPMEPCREKLFCNICKAAVVNQIDKAKCDTPHIKKLLDVHV